MSGHRYFRSGFKIFLLTFGPVKYIEKKIFMFKKGSLGKESFHMVQSLFGG